MEPRKIILLDIDDVILMDYRTLELQEPSEDFRVVSIHSDSTGELQGSWVDDSVLASLRALPPEVEIRWVSSWLAIDYSHIDHLTETLNLQRVSVPDLNGIEPGRWGMSCTISDLGHWKTEMMRNTLDENPDIPVLWVDDQLTFGPVRQLDYPTLSVMAPVPGRGLTPEKVNRIARWCADGQSFMQLGNSAEREFPLPN